MICSTTKFFSHHNLRTHLKKPPASPDSNSSRQKKIINFLRKLSHIEKVFNTDIFQGVKTIAEHYRFKKYICFLKKFISEKSVYGTKWHILNYIETTY